MVYLQPVVPSAQSWNPQPSQSIPIIIGTASSQARISAETMQRLDERRERSMAEAYVKMLQRSARGNPNNVVATTINGPIGMAEKPHLILVPVAKIVKSPQEPVKRPPRLAKIYQATPKTGEKPTEIDWNYNGYTHKCTLKTEMVEVEKDNKKNGFRLKLVQFINCEHEKKRGQVKPTLGAPPTKIR